MMSWVYNAAPASSKPGRLARTATALLGLLAATAGYLAWTQGTGPRPTPLPTIEQHARIVGDELSVDAGQLSYRAPLWELSLSGSPASMGAARAALLTPLLSAPQPAPRAGLWQRAVALGQPQDKLPDWAKLELSALASHWPNPGQSTRSLYRALLDRQRPVLQKLSAPGSDLGTSFTLVLGQASEGEDPGHLWIAHRQARSAKQDAQDLPLVTTVVPEKGLAYLSFFGALELGVQAGINERTLFASLTPMHSDREPDPQALAPALLLRELLQHCHNIQEAIEYLKQTPIHHAAAIVLAHGASERSAVIELVPHAAPSVRGLASDLVVHADHLTRPDLASDRRNREAIRRLASDKRQALLLRALKGRSFQDPQQLAGVLRQRARPMEPSTMPDPRDLEPVLPARTLIVDASTMQAFVGTGPGALGSFVGIDLRARLQGQVAQDPPDIPADPLLESEAFADLERARRLLAQAKAHLANEDVQAAKRAALVAQLQLPDQALTHKILHDIALAQGQHALANMHLEHMRELLPPDAEDAMAFAESSLLKPGTHASR